MKILVVLAAVIACTFAEEKSFLTLQDYNALFENPKGVDPNIRIVGGAPASAGQFPWQVAVQYRTSAGNYFCGGSLISSEWVLTAAHCAQGVISYTLYLGGTTLATSETGRITVTSTSYIVHEGYSSNTLNNDVALIRLPSPVAFTDRIQPVSLPSRGSVTGASAAVTVSGWGRTSDSSSGVSNVLNFVGLTTIANTQCASVYGSSVVISSTICAVGNPSESTCNGDSGGPLVVYDAAGTATQVGVVSFVHTAGCASGNPSGYVRTESFLDWISQNTGLDL